MRDRRCQFDVAHSLAANLGMGHLYPATIADHPLIFHAAVFSAGALPVFFGSKNTLAHQAVFFRTVGAVVDCFRFFNFTKRPTANVMRTRQTDFHRGVVVDSIVGCFANAHVFSPRNSGDGAVLKILFV